MRIESAASTRGAAGIGLVVAEALGQLAGGFAGGKVDGLEDVLSSQARDVIMS